MQLMLMTEVCGVVLQTNGEAEVWLQHQMLEVNDERLQFIIGRPTSSILWGIEEVQKHSVSKRTPTSSFISCLSRHRSSKKNNKEGGVGVLANTQRQKGEQERGIGGSRRGNEREKKRDRL